MRPSRILACQPENRHERNEQTFGRLMEADIKVLKKMEALQVSQIQTERFKMSDRRKAGSHYDKMAKFVMD